MSVVCAESSVVTSRSQRRRLRGIRRLWPVLVYACVTLGMLWQYRSPYFRPAGDLSLVLGFIGEGRNALRQGQFPIRVAPRQWEEMQYPVFQYYGNFPFTVTGEIARLVGNPYTAWKIATFLTLICGGIFTERLVYRLTRRRAPAVIAAIAFLLAPYQFADLNARGAFTEMVAMNLLPVAVYCSIRAFVSPRWRHIVWCALSWTVLGLTHNITYIYGALFVGAWLASYPAAPSKYLRRMARLAVAGVLHALLVLWYFAPQLATLKLLAISAMPLNPFTFAELTPLRVLLSPLLTTTPAGITAPGLSLQIGWAILGGFLLAISGIILRGRRFPRRGTAARISLLFLLACFLAWSPFDFWKYLPHVLWFVQFPYRLLIFAVLCGTMLLGMGLAAWFPRGLPAPAAVAAVCGVLVCTIPFFPSAPREFWPLYARRQMLYPDIGPAPRDAYLLSQPAARKDSWTDLNPSYADWDHVISSMKSRHLSPALPSGVTLAAADRHHVSYHRIVRSDYNSTGDVVLEFPVLYYPGLLDVRDHGRRISYGHAGHFLALRLGPGEHHLRVQYVGVRWANYASAAAWGGILALAAWRGLRRVNFGTMRPGWGSSPTCAS